MNNKEQDLIKLLNIFMGVVEANKGTPAQNDSRMIDAEGLAKKFFSHTISILYIYRGVNISDLPLPIISFPDPPSVNVLVRAAFETFLVFYYIFIDSIDTDEINLRYQSWELSGLYQRQGFPATQDENIEKLEEEKILIEKLEQKIKANSHFHSFSRKRREKYFDNIKKTNWRLKGWSEIARSAGLSELNSRIMYSYLCEHSHSGNISATQVSQSQEFAIRRELMEAALGHLVICLANMIKYYCQYFPKSLKFYQENFNEPNVVSFWIDIGVGNIE